MIDVESQVTLLPATKVYIYRASLSIHCPLEVLAVGLHQWRTVPQLLENRQHLLVGLLVFPLLVQLDYRQQLLQALLHHRVLPVELSCLKFEGQVGGVGFQPLLPAARLVAFLFFLLEGLDAFAEMGEEGGELGFVGVEESVGLHDFDVGLELHHVVLFGVDQREEDVSHQFELLPHFVVLDCC